MQRLPRTATWLHTEDCIWWRYHLRWLHDVLHRFVVPTLCSAEVKAHKAVLFSARIWSQINRHRFIHFYGEGNARLSRDQRMLETDAIKSPLILRACIRLLFNEPERYLTELDTLWVDELVCIDPWKAFVSSCLSDWRESVSWSLAVLLWVLSPPCPPGDITCGINLSSIS